MRIITSPILKRLKKITIGSEVHVKVRHLFAVRYENNIRNRGSFYLFFFYLAMNVLLSTSSDGFIEECMHPSILFTLDIYIMDIKNDNQP